MFKNIGSKIKTLTLILALSGAALSVFFGILWIFVASNLGLGGWKYLGIIPIVAGPLWSWVSSFLLYGFGQLIDNSDKLLKHEGINPNDII